MKKCFISMAKVVVAMCMAATVVISCNPDSIPEDNAPKGPTEEELAYVDSLENALYRQVRAMQVVLTTDDLLIESCVPGQDGASVITFSTGASVAVYPDAADSYTQMFTYVEEEEQKYIVLNSNGDKVALAAELDVKVKDNKYVLVAGEEQHQTGYTIDDKVQAFHCATVSDDNGVDYAVEFVFADDVKRLVYIAGYEGVYCYLPSDEEKSKISEVYVSAVNGAEVALVLPAEFDWKPVVSAGWKVTSKEVESVTVLHIEVDTQAVAPTDDAEDEELPSVKIVSSNDVFEFASVSLVSHPLKSFFVSLTDVVLAPATGVTKFAYGLSVYSDFNADQALAAGLSYISGEAAPAAGAAVSEVAVSRPFEEVLGEKLNSEERYVLWAVADGALYTLEFGEISVDIKAANAGLLDADVELAVGGASSIYCGLAEAGADVMDNILHLVNNKIYDPIKISENYTFSGKASTFATLCGDKKSIMPSSSYVVWVVPAVDGEYTYTEKDVLSDTFTTKGVTEGGSLELTCSDATVSPSTISFDLSCEGAAMIYYAYMTDDATRLTGDQVPNKNKFDEIIKSGSQYRKGDYVATIGDKVTALGKGFNDEEATGYWLFAVAVDSDGKYGKVICKKATTLKLDYDQSIDLAIETVDVKAGKLTLKVTSNSDLSDYIYWFGSSMSEFWIRSCNATRKGAQAFMALNPDDSNIVSAMRKNGRLGADGTITFDDLTMETEYVFVILEKGDVYYSNAKTTYVKTLAANLGTIVREGESKWNAEKERISIDWKKDRFVQGVNGLMSYYSFDISVPKEYTAYIMCASDRYLDNLGFAKLEYGMIYLENYASRRVDHDHAMLDENGELISEPGYKKVVDGELVERDGPLMNVYDFYLHGIPIEGTATYFAEGTHGDGNCIYWEYGECSIYKRALERLEYYRSKEPWIERARAFGLEGEYATAWADALYETYCDYYKNAEPIITVNDGSPLAMTYPYATGVNEDGIVPDAVIVMLKDANGNYFEPMYFPVPNYFEKK